MRTFSYYMLGVFSSIFFLFSCNQKKSDLVRIKVNAVSVDSVSLKIFHFPVFDENVLVNLNIDSTNTAITQFEIANPLMASFEINNTTGKVYLEPGYDLNIIVGNPISKNMVVFKGSGSSINNYIFQDLSLINKVIEDGLLDNGLHEFNKKIDSLKLIVEKFTDGYLDSVAMSEKETTFIKTINKIQLASLKAEYAFHLHNSSILDQIYALRDGGEAKTFEMPMEFKDISSDLILDTTFLSLEMVGYKDFLFQYLLETHNTLFELKNWERIDYGLARKSNTLLRHSPAASKVKEYLLANDIRYWINTQGTSPEVDSVFKEFKDTFTSSTYVEELQKFYDDRSAILPGKVAPDFKGKDLAGKSISLSDYKGKVVYIDVWATWCSPCIEEIPFSKRLQKKFENTNQVTFLNVSVDKDIDAWRSKMNREKDWLGVHINMTKSQADSLNINYKVDGYPKYIIVDKAGNIVNARAPKPSSGEIENIIKELVH